MGALLVCVAARVPHGSLSHLLDIPPGPAAGASAWLPRGHVEIWAAIPDAMGFFWGIEGVPLA
ncbi:MAG: ethanolamine permease, partial [Myxococcota bacterium]|nr:ethanolamine permease [Myxococcota bacterium]